MQANDRRRLNPPAGNPSPPVFLPAPGPRAQRTRAPNEHRRIFLRTGIVPSAAGSAYFELSPDDSAAQPSLRDGCPSSVKLTVTVHGPRPLPRNAAFTPNLLLTTHVKFAPFATHVRRGYVRDGTERDLGVHLENALRGVIIGERWPKGAVDVVVTVLEGEQDGLDGSDGGNLGWGMMTVLAGAVTASSAALAEAGIDCVDLVSGGVAGLLEKAQGVENDMISDPSPAEQGLKAACVVAYLQSRDEITELWMRGDAGARLEQLVDQAVSSAKLERGVLVEAVKETAEMAINDSETATPGKGKGRAAEVDMLG